MDQLRKEIENIIGFKDFLKEKYRFQTAFSIYLIAFGLLYIIFSKEYSIIVAFTMAAIIFGSSYSQTEKSEMLIHKIIGKLIPVIIVIVMSFLLILLQMFFPVPANYIATIVIIISIIFGFIYNIRAFYFCLPNSNSKLIRFISVALLFLLMMFIIIPSYSKVDNPLLVGTSIKAFVDAFNEMRHSEENIIARISTSATVISFGLFIMINVKNKLINEALTVRLRIKERLNFFLGKE